MCREDVDTLSGYMMVSYAVWVRRRRTEEEREVDLEGGDDWNRRTKNASRFSTSPFVVIVITVDIIIYLTYSVRPLIRAIPPFLVIMASASLYVISYTSSFAISLLSAFKTRTASSAALVSTSILLTPSPTFTTILSPTQTSHFHLHTLSSPSLSSILTT